MNQTYGDGTIVTGELVKDYVCIANNTAFCAVNYQWINVKSYTLGSNINGVLGLCLDPQGLDDRPAAKNYVKTLFE